MKKIGLSLGVLAFSMAAMTGSGVARADGDCPGHDCKPKTKPVCFNLVCHYRDKDNHDDMKSCTAASTFVKDVTVDGGEVVDDSDDQGQGPNLFDDNDQDRRNPTFQVNCDDKILFNNSAHRYTSLLGTIIQGEEVRRPG